MIEELYKFHMGITSVGYEYPGWHVRCLNSSPVLARHVLTYPWLSVPLHQRCIPSNCSIVVVILCIINSYTISLTYAYKKKSQDVRSGDCCGQTAVSKLWFPAWPVQHPSGIQIIVKILLKMGRSTILLKN